MIHQQSPAGAHAPMDLFTNVHADAHLPTCYVWNQNYYSLSMYLSLFTLMMNDEEEFSDCLECIGFDETAQDFMESAGLSTVDELLELGHRQLTALFPHAARYKPKVADREEQVNVPYTSVLKLQALRA